jgi:hypothetical protein
MSGDGKRGGASASVLAPILDSTQVAAGLESEASAVEGEFIDPMEATPCMLRARSSKSFRPDPSRTWRRLTVSKVTINQKGRTRSDPYRQASGLNRLQSWIVRNRQKHLDALLRFVVCNQ